MRRIRGGVKIHVWIRLIVDLLFQWWLARCAGFRMRDTTSFITGWVTIILLLALAVPLPELPEATARGAPRHQRSGLFFDHAILGSQLGLPDGLEVGTAELLARPAPPLNLIPNSKWFCAWLSCYYGNYKSKWGEIRCDSTSVAVVISDLEVGLPLGSRAGFSLWFLLDHSNGLELGFGLRQGWQRRRERIVKRYGIGRDMGNTRHGITVMPSQGCKARWGGREEEDLDCDGDGDATVVIVGHRLSSVVTSSLSQSLSAVVSGLRWLVQSLWCPSSSTWCCCVDFVVNVCCRLLISLSLRHKPDASNRYGWSLWWDEQRQWVLSGCGIG